MQPCPLMSHFQTGWSRPICLLAACLPKAASLPWNWQVTALMCSNKHINMGLIQHMYSRSVYIAQGVCVGSGGGKLVFHAELAIMNCTQKHMDFVKTVCTHKKRDTSCWHTFYLNIQQMSKEIKRSRKFCKFVTPRSMNNYIYFIYLQLSNELKSFGKGSHINIHVSAAPVIMLQERNPMLVREFLSDGVVNQKKVSKKVGRGHQYTHYLHLSFMYLMH